MMISSDRFSSQEDETAADDRRTASLAALAVVLLLVVAGLQLIHVLRSNAAIEDCLMAGRRNCDALTIPPPIP